MAEVTIPDLRSKSSPMFAPKKEDPYVANAVIKTEPGFTIKREPLSPVKAEQWTEHVEQLHVSQQGTENVQPSDALQWEEGDTKGVKREIKQERDNRGRCLQTSSTAEANSSNENHEPHIEDIKPFKKPKIEKKASKRKPSETRPASSTQGQQTSTIPATVLTKQEDIVCTVPNKQEDMVSTVPNKQEDMKTDNSPKTEDTDDEADWSPEDDTAGTSNENDDTANIQGEERQVTVCGRVRAQGRRRTHSGLELFTPCVCTVCGAKFDDDLDQLTTHRRTHDEAMPYKCSECGLGFLTLQQLREHKKKPYNFDIRKHHCTLCDETFEEREEYKLRYHLHIAHGIPAWTGEPPPHCTKCGKEFKAEDRVKQHMRDAHHIHDT